MKLTNLVLASCLLWSTGNLAAQSTVGDPISGTWSGDAGLSLTQRNPIKVDLKFDGRSALTGTIVGPPAVFKAGTFDTTTGALRFEVELTDNGGPAPRFVFEGTAIAGVATGQISDGTRKGSFKLVRGGAEPAAGSSSGDAAAALRKSFSEVAAWVSKAADLVPAEKYGYQPVKTVRTYGQLMAHLTDSFNYYCATAAGSNPQWSDPVEKGKTDKATVTPKLKQALEACNAVYAGNGQVGALTENVAHTSLHYGNIITYLRMLGLVPPSS